MCWLPRCAPRRRAADEGGVGAATSVVAQPSVQHLREALVSDEGNALYGEAAVLVSRRTAPRAAHCVPSERLRDDGYLGLVMLVPLQAASKETEAELVSRGSHCHEY